MIFDLEIPRRNAQMVALTIVIQKPAINFVIAFMSRANRLKNVWPSMKKQRQRKRINRISEQ